MKIVYKKVSDLIPYEKNPRKNDEAVEYVANSIKEFGFKVPIVIDKNGIIVTGHTRLKASKQLGIKEVPCIVAEDLTEEQVKAFRLADNKVSEASNWDYELLDEELDEILNLDMSDFNFTNVDIDWENVEDLTEKTYEEPTHKMLECPKCHHVDRDIHFKKVEGMEEETVGEE
jgi:hypothetical protein